MPRKIPSAVNYPKHEDCRFRELIDQAKSCDEEFPNVQVVKFWNNCTTFWKLFKILGGLQNPLNKFSGVIAESAAMYSAILSRSSVTAWVHLTYRATWSSFARPLAPTARHRSQRSSSRVRLFAGHRCGIECPRTRRPLEADRGYYEPHLLLCSFRIPSQVGPAPAGRNGCGPNPQRPSGTAGPSTLLVPTPIRRRGSTRPWLCRRR